MYTIDDVVIVAMKSSPHRYVRVIVTMDNSHARMRRERTAQDQASSNHSSNLENKALNPNFISSTYTFVKHCTRDKIIGE